MRELTKFISRYALQDGRNKKVLEIGIGDTTTFKDYFKEMRYNYVAVDTDERYVNQWCRLGDMNKLPFDDNEFDIIFACHSTEHCENPIQALKEIKRCSRKYIFLAHPFPSDHQVLKADEDHLFCLLPNQMERLFRFVKIIKINIYIDKQKLEQDWSVISIGEK